MADASLTFGSLFSGIGGFDLGFERAGMICRWQCEIDLKASDVLHHHWPTIPNIGDVKSVKRETAEKVDVICGGFPCQDLSVAGKRKGLRGERSGLWFEFARIVRELMPKWVVIENVPGLLSINQGKDFAIIIQTLVQFGYGVAWRVFDSQYDGLAQRRRRVFIVASLGSGRAAEILFEREGMSWHPSSSQDQRKEDSSRVRDSLTTGWDSQRARIHDSNGVAPTLNSGAKNSGNIVPAVAFTQNTRNEVRLLGGDGQIAGSLQAESGMHQTNYIANWQSGGGKMDSDKDASLRSCAESNYQFVYGSVGVRRLTPTEYERLQGFPDGWTSGQPDTTRYRQLGNAVSVPVVNWIGRRIVKEANHE